VKGTQEIYDPHYDPANGGKPEFVREALWGKGVAFDKAHPIYKELKAMAQVRNAEPALRYGRQYFRQVSGNSNDFGFSREKGGVIAFSRILNDREVVVIANSNVKNGFSGEVVIDARVNGEADTFKILYSNEGTSGTATIKSGSVRFYDRNNSPSDGWARRIPVTLGAMEVQVLAKV
jgi:hypothetical protein